MENVTASAKSPLDQRQKCNIFGLENETETAIHIFTRDVNVTLFLKNQQHFKNFLIFKNFLKSNKSLSLDVLIFFI